MLSRRKNKKNVKKKNNDDHGSEERYDVSVEEKKKRMKEAWKRPCSCRNYGLVYSYYIRKLHA